MIRIRRDGATTKSKLAPLDAKIKLRAERAARRERPNSGKSETSRRSENKSPISPAPSPPGLRLRRAPPGVELIDHVLRQTAGSRDVDRVATLSVGDRGIGAGVDQEVQGFQAL